MPTENQPFVEPTTSSDWDVDLRRLTSFAVMTVDWSQHSRSYLDNFLNYVLAAIPANSSSATPRQSIRPLIIEQFNLSLPESIVQQLLKRAHKLGYIAWVGDNGVRLTPKGAREVAPIPYTLKKLSQDQQRLIRKFVAWAEEELSFSMDYERATTLFLDYLETYYCALMHLADGDGGARRFPGIEPTAEQKTTAAFISTIAQEDPDLFDIVADLARGSMMVSALYSPSLVDTTKGFRKTTIYLDTKIVFRALGYEGPAAEQSTCELIKILKRQGARVGVFDFTLREIRSVIDAVSQKAGNGSLWMARPGSVEAYFYRENAPRSLIEQHSVRLESKIAGLGVEIDTSPPYATHRHIIDEASVEEVLLRGNPNYRPSALRHDVELIASIVRARAGRARKSLEESRATFMTMNSLVVRTARTIQKEHGEDWPLVMFETDIAALAWVKEPLAAPELPRLQLLSTSLGLTTPGKHAWSLYISEIERLLGTTEITDNDLVLLRQKYETDRLAFVSPVARGSDARASITASIESAREAVAAELTAPMREELQRHEAEIDRLEAELTKTRELDRSREEEADELMRSLLRPVWKRAKVVKLASVAVPLTIAFVALAVSYIPGVEAFLTSLPIVGGWLVILARALAILIALAGGLIVPLGKLGDKARQRYLLASLAGLSVDPARAAEVGFKVIEL